MALRLPESYYEKLASDYEERRNIMLSGLEDAGFRSYAPGGAYYIMTDISGFGFSDDVSFGRHLIESVGVAAVPGSSFYHRPEAGAQKLRFTFCKKKQTLDAAEHAFQEVNS